MIDNEKLSREVSYALRHKPDVYGLSLDSRGWVPLNDLVAALRSKPEWKELTAADVEAMVTEARKKRHEIAGGRIRARYGHSTPERIEKQPCQLPSVLYHGTARRFLDAIMHEGLRSMGRQYVHLSEEEELARMTGERHDEHPIVLRVDAARAWMEGIAFYCEEGGIWLADAVPVQYLNVMDA